MCVVGLEMIIVKVAIFFAFLFVFHVITFVLLGKVLLYCAAICNRCRWRVFIFVTHILWNWFIVHHEL